jgi:hypothetical protein
MKHMAFILTPAYPAAWLLFGMLFGLAAAYFLAASWSKTATAVIYTVPLVWVALVARHRPETLRGLNRIDVLFAVFILAVLTSLTVMQGGQEHTWKLLRYMPFMMAVPYVCGRLMRAPDIDLFSRITLVAGTAILPLLLIDRFTSAGRGTARWPFFGQDHGALLVGALLAITLIALCVRVLACRNPDERNNRLNQLARYGLIGLITVFLVWVTARGWLLKRRSMEVGVGVAVRTHILHASGRAPDGDQGTDAKTAVGLSFGPEGRLLIRAPLSLRLAPSFEWQPARHHFFVRGVEVVETGGPRASLSASLLTNL